MKTLIKPLLVALTLTLVALSTSFAGVNPTDHPVVYKTGIYTNTDGKLVIALDKETGGAVDVRLKTTDGRVLFAQHLGKKEKAYRTRLNLSELQDGHYQVEITNGVETTIHTVTLSTQQPSIPGRMVAIN